MREVIKRINARRPFQITAEGLKRIILGELASGTPSARLPADRRDNPGPVRLQVDPNAFHLVIAHADRGVLEENAHQAIAAAALLADASTAVVVLVLGELTEELSLYGADNVFAVPSRDAAVFDPAADLAIALELISRFDPRHILMPDNGGAASDLGRRLAARLAEPVASHVMELRPDALASYWQGGASIARRDLTKIILLDPDTTDIALPFRGLGKRTDWPGPAASVSPYLDLGSPPVDFAQLGLEEADFIVSAGSGVADIPTLHAVAKAFNAAIGASRVAVDDGKFRREQQIGATGKTVTANVYLAIGISGAVQHLQGIKAVRHVIAINTDATAPIVGRANLSVVDDAQAVMEQLLEATRQRNMPTVRS